jgi:hypothetical protein
MHTDNFQKKISILVGKPTVSPTTPSLLLYYLFVKIIYTIEELKRHVLIR